MKVQTNFRNVILSNTDKGKVMESALLMFSKFRYTVRGLKIVAENNDDASTLNGKCTVTVNSKLPEPIVIVEKRADVHQAIHFALKRANQTLARKWKRNQYIQRNPAPALYG